MNTPFVSYAIRRYVGREMVSAKLVRTGVRIKSPAPAPTRKPRFSACPVSTFKTCN